MIHLASSLLLTLAVSGDHAALHPASANLYVEFPDMPAALTAYQGAPLVRMFMDEEVGSTFRTLAGLTPEFDVSELVLAQVEGMLDPATFGAAQALFGLAGEMRSMSMSIGGLAGGEADRQGQELIGGNPGALLGLLEVQMVMEFDAAEAPERVLGMAVEALPAASSEDGPATVELMGEQRQVHRFLMPGGSQEQSMWMVSADRMLILGMGTARPEGLAARAAGGASLMGREGDLVTAERFTNPSGATIYNTTWWLPSTPFYGKMVADQATEAGAGLANGLIGQWLPLEPVSSRSRLQLRDGRFVKETLERPVAAPGESRPSTLGHAPLDPAILTRVGPESLWVWATTISSEGLRGLAETLVENVLGGGDAGDAEGVEDAGGEVASDDGRAEFLGQLTPVLDQVVGSIGKDMVVYMLPIAGLKVPQIHVLLDVKDAGEFEQGVKAFATMLEGQAGGMLSLDTRPYRRQPVISLRPDLERMGVPPMISLDLTIGIVGDRAIVGLSAMDVKKEMRSLLTGEPGAHPLTQEGSVPEGVTGVSYMDWGSLVGGIYEMARSFAGLVPDAGMLPVDITQLPEAALFTRFFEPSRSFSRALGGVTYSFSESSFGPEVVLGALAGGAAFFFTQADQGPWEQGAMPVTDIIEPSPGTGDPLDGTREALQQVKLGLVIYRSDRGELPQSLEPLLAPTEAFPSGYLSRSTLPVDGWGQPLRYRFTGEGQGFVLWSVGPDGVDEDGAGDDVQAP